MKTAFTSLAAALTGALLISSSAPVLAQANANVKKEAPGATKAAVAPKAGDKLMSKEELRACMKLKSDIDSRRADITKRSEALKEEKLTLSQPTPAFAEARARVDAQLERVKQADNAVKEQAQRVQEWNDRMAEFEANKKEMRNADRRANVLKQERVELQADAKKLNDARAEQVAVYEGLVKAANDLRGSQGNRAEDWNKRNDALADEEDAIIDMRANYAADCANRRFREDDEAAIKAGK